MAAYVVVSQACANDWPQRDLIVYSVWGGGLVVSLVGGIAAYLALHRIADARSGRVQRARFMATSGMLLAGLGVAMILFHLVPIPFLQWCANV